MKYIVNNCDNYTNLDDDWTCRSTIQNRKGCYCCKDTIDCLLKRIVERCSLYEFNYPVNYAIQMLTQNIYDMLEIEEVDEE